MSYSTNLEQHTKRRTDSFLIKDNLTLCQVYDFRTTGKMKQYDYYRKQMKELMKDGIDIREASEQLKRKYRAKAIQANEYDFYVEAQ